MKFNIIFLTIFVYINIVIARSFDLPSYFNPADYHYSVAKNVIIKDCSRNRFPLHIKSIRITPDIVSAGSEITIKATGYLEKPVLPGAIANVQVKLGVVRLLRKRFDLCNELDKNKKDVDLQCPIEQGLITVTQKVTLPKEVPKAKFIVDVHAFFDEEEKSPLACLSIIADFRKRKFGSHQMFFQQDCFQE